MKLVIPVNYAVPPSQLMRALTDRDFHAEKIRRLQPLSFEIVEHSKVGSKFSIRVRRTMRNEAAVPALLKKLVPATSVIEHIDTWDTKTGKGQVVLSIAGLPVQLGCSITATARGNGTELSHDWEILCRLPVVGSAAERFIAGDLPRLMELEADAARPALERYT
ncbi:MAG: DUF2505 domain-containing protein [Stagnimonas sp.]|nr:DUF2505 domain-containing protein [Stagnimonas sp.]